MKTKWDLADYRSNIDWVLARQSHVDRVRQFVYQLRERLTFVRSLRAEIVDERELSKTRSLDHRSLPQREEVAAPLSGEPARSGFQ